MAPNRGAPTCLATSHFNVLERRKVNLSASPPLSLGFHVLLVSHILTRHLKPCTSKSENAVSNPGPVLFALWSRAAPTQSSIQPARRHLLLLTLCHRQTPVEHWTFFGVVSSRLWHVHRPFRSKRTRTTKAERPRTWLLV